MNPAQTLQAARVAVVGGARGIGFCTTRLLVQAGHRVAAIDMEGEEAAPGYLLGDIHTADFSGLPGAVLRIPADMRRVSDSERAASRIAEEFGGLDQLVVAAGAVFGGRPLAETPLEEMHEAWNFNLATLHNSVTGLLPAIKASRYAHRRVVAVASAAGSKGLWGIGAYVSAKHAVAGYMKTLALELAAEGITANCVSPGSARTEILRRTAQLYSLADMEDFASQQPLGRLLEPEEVAAAIAFLLGPQAGGITGLDMHVDAGFTL